MNNPILEQLRKRIDQHGWTVMGVFADPEAQPPVPSFAYTIGLTENCQHPELVIMGLPPEVAQSILAGACERIKQGTLTCQDSASDDRVVEGYSVMFRTVHPNHLPDYLRAARAIEGDDVRAVQIIWPDPAGTFPWQTGADPDYAGHQMLLFDATPTAH
jgi:hypothetical protein